VVPEKLKTSKTSLSAGTRSLILSSGLPDEINKDKPIKTVFSAVNLSQQPVSVKGEYKLYRAKEKEPLLNGVFSSNEEAGLSAFEGLPSGEYKLILSAKDDKNRDVTSEKELVLFSVNDKTSPVSKSIWFKLINKTFSAEQPATIVFGTTKKDVYVLYDVYSAGKRIDSKCLVLSEKAQRFDFPYKEEYGDGIYVNFCFVKNGILYQQGEEIIKAIPSSDLTMKWEVFRDKLQPGQKEEWKLTIKDPQGKAANAELLATMYDASLDKIWKRDQRLNVSYSRNIPSFNWQEDYKSNNYYSFYFPGPDIKFSQLSYDFFCKDAGEIRSQEELTNAKGIISIADVKGLDEVAVVGYGTLAKGSIRGVSSRASVAEMKFAAPVIKRDEEVQDSAVVAQSEEELLAPVPTLRENFNETAFFYPQLRTNEQGEITISFTMPESLTKWNFRGYAHTKEMFTGQLDGETVTSKEFMLSPNMPRFVRVGDKSSLAASVINLTAKDIKGEVKMQLFDPETEKVIFTQKQPFAATTGKTVNVTFTFTADEKYPLLGCRIVADGGKFSDGEQHLLPVLSNKERITETLAMPVRGNETREFSLDKLFNGQSKTATDRKLTVEFTGNSAWYAVQALPTLSNPTNENAISWVAAFYANSLASYIVNAQPRIKTVLDAWKQQGATKETLWSNLQKNQDLKNIILEESPWLTEATNEAQQQQRLSLLFDLNNIQNNNTVAISKLKDLQMNDGSWAWYKGMNGSRYITLFVVETLSRLSLLTAQPIEQEALEMQTKAFNYLHAQTLEEYKQMKKDEKQGNKGLGISDPVLQYLYLCAITGEKIPASNKEAYNYYIDKVKETIASQTLLGKAVSAVILDKADKKADAVDFIKSLKEYTVHTDEMGVYFPTNIDPCSWFGYKIPVHTAVLEAFDKVAKDSATVEEMKMWLLKQKQTQAWDSPMATVDAVYALLNRGANLISDKGDVKITLGGQVIETYSPAKTSVPATGYVKKSFEGNAITPKMNVVTVEKRDAGIAWGAVYAQYQEELDKVKKQGGELNVDKKLYVEKVVNNVKELHPITNEMKLEIGDKVISRITIKLDRDMDFVQLKDQRAACFEPLESISGYRWGGGTTYYVAVKDASTNFFFDSLRKGVYVLEHSFHVTRSGNYSSGIAVLQSAYAPEFSSHSASLRVAVK